MNTVGDYEKYKHLRLNLEKMLSDGSSLLYDLGITQHAEALHTLGKTVASETFRIMIVGQFKTGKSTFINSLLGAKLLPAYATPCTAVINEVKHGNEKKAILFFKDPLPEKLPTGISSQILTHMKQYSKNIPPIEIPVDEIEDFVVIPIGKEYKETLLESPYDKIELYWPLELLQNGVEIIDSPGLNEHEIRTKVTLEYLFNADAILFVLSSIAPCAKTEMDFIDNYLHKSGFNEINFIFNRFDQVPSAEEKERIKSYGIQKLRNATSFGEKGIFFLSAAEALKGKLTKDIKQVEHSGILELEKSLADFLINQRGKVKLARPSKELKRIISESLFTTIPQQRAMLNTSLAEVEQKYADAKPKLDNLAVRKRQMSDRIDLSIARMIPEIRRCIQSNFNDISGKIPEWLGEIETENQFETFHPTESSQRIIQELLAKIESKIEFHQVEWQNKVLVPLIAEKIQDMKDSIEANIENFYVELDSIKVNMAGLKEIEGAKNVSAFERVGAAAVGLFVGDIGAAAIGGNFGFSKTFWKQLAIQIGAVFTMLLVGITNPLTMLPVILGIMAWGLIRGKSGMIDQIKAKCSEGMTKELNRIAGTSGEEIVTDVEQNIRNITKVIIEGLENEIKAVQIQVEEIINDLKAGEAEVEKRRQMITKKENELIKINQELDDFILGLIENK